jgi:hypothetical protein
MTSLVVALGYAACGRATSPRRRARAAAARARAGEVSPLHELAPANELQV